MPNNPEQRPGVQPSSLPEPLVLPETPLAVTDGTYTVFLAKRKDGLSVRIQQGETNLYAVGVSTTQNEEGQTVHRVRAGVDIVVFSAEEEPEPTIQLWGNIGTDIQHSTSPQGVAMASFQFGEHPVLYKGSYYNNQSEEERPRMSEKNTVWRTVVAFGDRVSLLENATTKQPYILTCVPRTWAEKSNGSKEKTVHGFHLLNIEAVPTNKSKTKTPPGQKPLL